MASVFHQPANRQVARSLCQLAPQHTQLPAAILLREFLPVSVCQSAAVVLSHQVVKFTELRDDLIVAFAVKTGERRSLAKGPRSTVRRKPVEKGWDFGKYVEVGSGLSSEDEVILGAGDLEEGARVATHLTDWDAP